MVQKVNKAECPICIFEYTDYRSYLSDMFNWKRKHQASFSYRSFVKKAELGSPGYLTMIIGGKRNLSLRSIAKFTRGLQLNQSEADFFESLVLFNQAEALEEKRRYFEKLRKHPQFKKLKLLSQAQYDFMSHWQHIAIRELVGLKAFRPDPIWIAKALNVEITPKQAKESLALLEKLGLIVKGKDGRYRQSDLNISSGNEVSGLAVMNYHQEMMQQAKVAMEKVPHLQRDISSVTLSIKREKLEALKREIQYFRKRLLHLAEEGAEESDQVVQLNMQFFPLSHKKIEDI